MLPESNSLAWQQVWLGGRSSRTAAPLKLWPLIFVTAVVFILLWFRLFMLQVLQGSDFLVRAEENRLVARRIAAGRGIIFDRQGRVLARNKASYKTLEPGSTLSEDRFASLTRDEAMDFRLSADKVLFWDSEREYPYGRSLAMVLGYVGEVSREELGAVGDGYVAGDLIGKLGVEKSMEQRLRGTPGWEYLEVDSHGTLLRQVGLKEAVAGSQVNLAVDALLTQQLYDAMEGYTGAGIVTRVKTGEVLALVSRPAFDQSDIAGSLEEPGQPFFNRAIAGVYPPGSVFKVIVAIAGLEEGKIDTDTHVTDTGELRVGAYRYGNWYFDQYGRTEGEVDVVKALQRSNDIFFYKVGEWVGPEKLAAWAGMWGLGKKTGIELPGEVAGVVPDPVWKERVVGERWFLGNTYHLAIGQGDLQVTPLQMHAAAAVIANAGRLCRPTLLKLSEDVGGECQELGINPEAIALVKLGMVRACESGGTAFPFFDFEPRVACKTGTSQFGIEDKTHAWFSAFAPADNPEIAVTILLEKAGQGSYEAAPVAKKVLEYWFHQRLE